MAITITPRLGRLRVRDHCSFFWAEHRLHRVVQISKGHCPECIGELRAESERLGIVLHLVETDAATTDLLEQTAFEADRRRRN